VAKFCPGCKTEKPVAEFSRNKRRHDGLTNYCRDCWRDISRAQYQKNRDKLAARYLENRAAGKKSGRNRSPEAPCDQCGLSFRPRKGVSTCLPCRDGKPIKHGHPSTYVRGCRCGPCKQVASSNALRNKRERLLASGLPDDNRHRTRARRFGGQYQPIDRQAVFDRDAWRCGICKQPVDKGLPWPDPMSVSLDHIVPMSLGGDHSYENVQCAHLSCNQTKAALHTVPGIRE
jgi:HNH endonuclease